MLALLSAAALSPSAALGVTFASQPPAPVGSTPVTVVSGNFNGDALSDVAVANFGSNSVSVLLGDGGGWNPKPNVTVGNGPLGLAAADVIGDSRIDFLVVGNQTGSSISTLAGNGSGSFTQPDPPQVVSRYPRQLATGDLNGDTTADLVYSSVPPGAPPGLTVALRQGTGYGTYNLAAGNFDGVVLADFNGDTKLDLAAANQDTNTVAIFRGNGDGFFVPMPSPGAGTLPSIMAAADFDSDGDLDLAVVNQTSTNVSILRNNGDATFTGPVNYALGAQPSSVAIGDFDTDGSPDLAVSSSCNSDTVSILLGNGDATFGAPTSIAAHACPSSVAAGDFNGDGQHDFALTSTNTGRLVAFLNTTPPTGYPRPRGATPMRAALVLAYQACGAPNSTHGAPLSFSSCKPPAQSSPNLTVGTPDANGAAANASGSVLLRVQTNPAPTPNDVAITVSTNDVRCKPSVSTCGSANTADGPDYTGQLQVTMPVRLTDRLNGYFKNAPGTVSDTPFAFTVPCTATASSATGATCSTTTSANSLVPGIAQTGKRAVWELQGVQVFDGGPDGVVSTAGNSLFEDQGIFIP